MQKVPKTAVPAASPPQPPVPHIHNPNPALALREPNRERPVQAPNGDDEEPSGVSFTHRLWVIRRNIWAISAFVVFCTVATAIISYRIIPIFQATATIDVDRRAPAGVVGQDATSSQIGDTEQFLNTQVRLIQSDSVLKTVAQDFGIRKAPGSVGMANLTVTRPPGTFLILISFRSPDPTRAAEFSNAVAASYIRQTYNIRYRATMSLSTFMEKQIEELHAKMERSSEALNRFTQELGMIRPEEANGIVSARLLQLNTEYTTAQADRVRKQAFESLKNGDLASAEVSSQGEPLRRLVERVNDAREKFTEANRLYGTDHPEFRKASEHVKQLTAELTQAKTSVTNRAESEFKEAANREAILQKQVDTTKAEFDHLNARGFQYTNLKREAEADRKLYEELANRIKEAGINAGFQNPSSIRLADEAQPPNGPVYPDIPRNIEIAFFSSLLLAMATALAADAMDATLRNPEDVERTLGSHVIGILPLVKQWRGGWLSAVTPGGITPGGATPGLAGGQNGAGAIASNGNRSVTPQTTFYEDAVCSLRNSILLSSFGNRSGHSS